MLLYIIVCWLENQARSLQPGNATSEPLVLVRLLCACRPSVCVCVCRVRVL